MTVLSKKRQEAEKIIGKENIMSDWSLRMNRINHYLFWNVGSDSLYLEGHFGIDEIEAILWWTKHIT